MNRLDRLNIILILGRDLFGFHFGEEKSPNDIDENAYNIDYDPYSDIFSKYVNVGFAENNSYISGPGVKPPEEEDGVGGEVENIEEFGDASS